jgi:NTE family protein
MNMERSIRNGRMPEGRVVTLTFLSSRSPASSFTEPLAEYLHTETGSTVLLLRLTDAASPAKPAEKPSASLTFDGSYRQLPDLLPTDAGFHLFNLRIGHESYRPGWIESLLEELRSRFDYILIEAVSEELTASWLFEFLLHSDTGYMFVRASNDDVYHLDLLVRELTPRLNDSKVEIKPVLCLHEGELVDGYDALIRRVAGPVEVFVRGCLKTPDDHGDRPTGSFHADLRRLAREISNSLVGLALSSGAAKGLSHIGVIQVLEENGIDIDIVAGSSMGAYVGAIWAAGFNGQKLEEIAREMELPWAFWTLIDPAFPPRQGFLRGYAIKKRLMRSIGHVRFAELQRPFRVMATNLETLERVVFSSGEVAEAVHASIAVPGICVPVKIDGETYIDGGIVDPLPVDVLREMGISRIIAVNAIPTPDRIRYCRQAERELAQLSRKRAREVIRKWIPIESHLNYFSRGNILEILLRSIHGGQVRMAETLGRGADIVLRPEICDDRWTDFRNPGRFIRPGRQIAERYLDEIKALTAKKTVKHETTVEHMAAVA